jgi:BirA family biotin operon repressor/biotin-[acetyl-CoA-carboxylase] ligase
MVPRLDYHATAMNPMTLAALRYLSSSRFVSGESIAEEMGVTRATVWNAVREALQHGVPVEKVRGRGYRLAFEPVWLDESMIIAALGRNHTRFLLQVVPEVASTNTDLLRHATAGAPSGTVLAAELQTAGRGRRGRSWQSPLGSSLTFSLLWRFEQGASVLSGLSLVVGIACARALEASGASGVTLKWPNDLQVAGRKLGGILIELQGDALGPSAAVIGIGINVRLPGEFVERLDQPAVDLHRAGGGDDRNLLLAALLRELADCIDGFASQGFAPFEQEYRARHALQGADVDIAMPDGSTVSGTVEGTNLDGSLRVATGRGLRSFHGGEVSVRRTPV